MSKRLNVGDTVVIRGVVTEESAFAGGVVYVRLENAPNNRLITIHESAVSEVIPGPLQVGDTVYYGRDSLPHTLLCIQEDPKSLERRWGVIAYKTDIPQVFQLSELRRQP